MPGALPREGAHHEAGRLAVEVLGVVAASVLPEPSHRYRGIIEDRGTSPSLDPPVAGEADHGPEQQPGEPQHDVTRDQDRNAETERRHHL